MDPATQISGSGGSRVPPSTGCSSGGEGNSRGPSPVPGGRRRGSPPPPEALRSSGSKSSAHPSALKFVGRQLGRILCSAEKVTRDELKEALDIQEKQGGRLGEILVRAGNLSELNLNAALAGQRGDLVCWDGHSTPSLAEAALPARPLGYILIEMGKASADDILLERQLHHHPIGESLVKAGRLSEADLQAALALQTKARENGLR